MTMTPKEAIAIVNDVTGTFRGTRADHIKIELAVSTLLTAVNELEELQADKVAIEASKNLPSADVDESSDPLDKPEET